MTRLPRTIDMILCDEMRVDNSNAKTSLEGLFHARFLPTFPSAPQAFAVYVALIGGQGEAIMELRVTSMETERDIYFYKKWFAVSEPDRIINVEIKVRKCQFPFPGRYGFSLRFDGEEVSHRILSINQE